MAGGGAKGGDSDAANAGNAVVNGVIVIDANGKIEAIGSADTTRIPNGYSVVDAEIVTPGLIDARATVGLSGIYNQRHDQDHLDRSGAVQPELRALDAVNVREELIGYLRGFGVTTIHTGNSMGELISGQTLIMKTVGDTAEEAALVETAAVVATLGPRANRDSGSPGTRGKQMAILRQELIKAQDYVKKQNDFLEKQKKSAASLTEDAKAANESSANDLEAKKESEAAPPDRDLRLETLGRVLKRELPLLVTANKAQDISTALRLAEEFNVRVWLDGAAESYLLIDSIRDAGIPVFLHPSMTRTAGEFENLSFETASKLVAAGIPVVMQSGYEGYVPKTRVVLFEAAITAANGLSFEQALATITSDAARVLGISERVGSLEVGKDADLALFDGDPFEYTTHCTGVVINGVVHDGEQKSTKEAGKK
jgi:imidazolonepropionase-like amidohydrolase